MGMKLPRNEDFYVKKLKWIKLGAIKVQRAPVITVYLRCHLTAKPPVRGHVPCSCWQETLVKEQGDVKLVEGFRTGSVKGSCVEKRREHSSVKVSF
ncbi:hypothetical protein M5K25_012591 [Dendrobium thyrsiflorum]|uniref:Uncharacterized protein n=1 Tax=Dendrobium thyrsiflorum TaxID=117978 RepID=A0ABD0UYB4_DENTH